MLVFLFPIYVNVIQIPARFVLGIYLVLDNLLPFLLTRGAEGGGVAHGAHIGGFIAGLGIAWIMSRRELSAKPGEYRRTAQPSAAPLDELRSAIEHGEMERAARAYFALPPEQSRRFLMPAEMLALGDWLAANGHPDAALTMYRHVLRDYPRGPGLAEAHVGAGMVQLEARGQATTAYQHFLQALDLDPAPDTFTRAQAGLDAVTRKQRYLARGR
jgi:tetratricopeptide (TPR) repeat protein